MELFWDFCCSVFMFCIFQDYCWFVLVFFFCLFFCLGCVSCLGLFSGDMLGIFLLLVCSVNFGLFGGVGFGWSWGQHVAKFYWANMFGFVFHITMFYPFVATWHAEGDYTIILFYGFRSVIGCFSGSLLFHPWL